MLAPSQKEQRSQELWDTIQVSLLDLLDDDTHTRLLELDEANEIGSMAPRRRRTLMPKGQTNRSDTWALSAEGARHRTHAPIGLLALSFL